MGEEGDNKSFNEKWSSVLQEKQAGSYDNQVNIGQSMMTNGFNNGWWSIYPYPYHDCRPKRYCPYCGQLLNQGYYPYWGQTANYNSVCGGHQI
jgi:hypothetical protein